MTTERELRRTKKRNATQLKVWIDRYDHEQIKKLAEKYNTTLAYQLSNALTKYIKESE